MESVILRPCREQDFTRVLFIERESFPDPYEESVFGFFLHNPRSSFVVACDDGGVVGYVIATRGPAGGVIQSIAVSSSHRGRGIGGMLMRSAMEYLSNCRRVILLVSKTNDSAVRLYRGFSFRETGRVFERYYPNGDDALEFARELPN